MTALVTAVAGFEVLSALVLSVSRITYTAPTYVQLLVAQPNHFWAVLCSSLRLCACDPVCAGEPARGVPGPTRRAAHQGGGCSAGARRHLAHSQGECGKARKREIRAMCTCYLYVRACVCRRGGIAGRRGMPSITHNYRT